MTNTTTITYRKTSQGETETVTRLGRPFAADGVECCYGYLSERTRSSSPARRSHAPRTHEDCLSFGHCIHRGTGRCTYH